MRVVLASMFRNSSPYLSRYFSQIESLRLLGHDVELILAEGDSTDDTPQRLRDMLNDAGGGHLVTVNHGGKHYGSVDHLQRWHDIARVVCGIQVVARYILDDPDDADAFIWVESDLIWNFSAMSQLLADLDEVPAVAPMVLAGDSKRFYDTYGFRKNGRRFDGAPPYHPELIDDLCPIDSCGSAFVLSPPIYPELLAWDGHWPVHFSQLWVDRRVAIRHP